MRRKLRITNRKLEFDQSNNFVPIRRIPIKNSTVKVLKNKILFTFFEIVFMRVL